MRLPTYFISHGSPELLLGRSAARTFLEDFAAQVRKPRAIVIASAHFMTRAPAVDAAARPGMIYDFGGFPDPLYEKVYAAPGDPALAAQVAALMERAGLAPQLAPREGFDHGTWVPLSLMYPQADIPVVQIAVQPKADPAHHYRLGQALASLPDDDVLVIGSGSATHNLHEMYSAGYQMDSWVQDWVVEFCDWIAARAGEGAVDDLTNYRERAPQFRANHPTDEHFLPFMVALGAAGAGARGERIHASVQYGVLAMDCYAFR
ncbi:MAG: dioxygenase [Xanthobacteraceae bacterium]|nr:MAG: dioxygenase [Xanthobacteraceae bacterium]